MRQGWGVSVGVSVSVRVCGSVCVCVVLCFINKNFCSSVMITNDRLL